MVWAASHAPPARRLSPTLLLGRLPYPGLSHVWAGLAVVAAALGSALLPIEAIDYWWTIELGALIRASGHLTPPEVLVYTPLRGPFPDGQWLARVALSLVHDTGGVELSLALRSVVAIAGVLLLLRLCVRAGADLRVASVVSALATVLFVPGLAVRAQMLTLVPFLLVLGAALAPPRSLAGRLGLGLVVAVWANLHGSFVLAYPLLAAGLVDAAWGWWRTGERAPFERSLLLAAVCAPAPLLNPFGLDLTRYVGDAVLFNAVGPEVGVLGTEWGAPAIRTGYGALFYSSVLLVVGLLASGRRPRLGEGLLLVLFAVLGVQAVRHVLWWSLVLVPYVARAATDLLTTLCARRGRALPPLALGMPALNAALLATFALAAAACLPWWREQLPLPPARTALVDAETPIAVAEYLAAHPTPGHLFNATNWGAYFGWRLGPERPVFIDNRFELHPTEVWKDYVTIVRGHVTWERLLDRYGVDQLALDVKGQAALVEAVAESPAWRETYRDGQAVVFERRPSP